MTVPDLLVVITRGTTTTTDVHLLVVVFHVLPAAHDDPPDLICPNGTHHADPLTAGVDVTHLMGLRPTIGPGVIEATATRMSPARIRSAGTPLPLVSRQTPIELNEQKPGRESHFGTGYCPTGVEVQERHSRACSCPDSRNTGNAYAMSLTTTLVRVPLSPLATPDLCQAIQTDT